MKKLLFLLMVVVPILGFGQTTTENYIKSTTYSVETTDGQVANSTDKIESIVYIDGLGRPIQQVATIASGTGRDIITPIVYDHLGRKIKEYLPYVNGGQIPLVESSLNMRLNDAMIDIIPNYYNTRFSDDFTNGILNAYSEKVVESSPLNRVFEQSAQAQVGL